MKRLAFCLAILFLAHGAYAVDWHKADSKTVAWDAPTQYADGTPIPSGLQWVYTVYIREINSTVVTAIGTVDTTASVIQLSEGQKVFVGVSATYTDGDGLQVESEVAWSDNAIDCADGVTFGIYNLKRPGKPGRLRPL